jgi:hypothetical protein
MFDGFEIDMLSLGDADCILVTQWSPFDGYPFRVLIDGGSRSHAKLILVTAAARFCPQQTACKQESEHCTAAWMGTLGIS